MSMKDCLQLVDESIASLLRVPPDSDFVAQWVREYARNHRFRLAKDVELVQRYAPPGAKILEFGSSPFFLTLALERAGHDVCGLDLTPELFAGALAAHALDIRKVDFEREPVPLPDEAFQLVLFNEVFEHLRIDLIFTMSEVRRVLRADGTLLLSTPNHRSLVGIWTLLWHQLGCHACPDLYQEHDNLRRLGHMGHVREYTAREVSHFLARIGLHTKDVLFRYFRQGRRESAALSVRDFIEHGVGAVVPSLRPLFSLVCTKCDPIP